MSKHVPLQPGKYYHIYNRGNNQENIFVEELNYPYFLKLYAQHVEPVADTYLVRLVTYIHQNPQKHRFVTDFRDWPYSSYHAHLSAKPTRLKRDDVLAWYDGADHFARAHERAITAGQMTALAPDDFD